MDMDVIFNKAIKWASEDEAMRLLADHGLNTSCEDLSMAFLERLYKSHVFDKLSWSNLEKLIDDMYKAAGGK